MSNGFNFKFLTKRKHFLAKRKNHWGLLFQTYQNILGFMQTYKIHLQECERVHMWHGSWFGRNTSGFRAVHLWFTSMMMEAHVCTMYCYRIAGVSTTLAKQIQHALGHLGCRGHFTSCIVL